MARGARTDAPGGSKVDRACGESCTAGFAPGGLRRRPSAQCSGSVSERGRVNARLRVRGSLTKPWARRVSNLRPLACEASALPLSYAPGRNAILGGALSAKPDSALQPDAALCRSHVAGGIPRRQLDANAHPLAGAQRPSRDPPGFLGELQLQPCAVALLNLGRSRREPEDTGCPGDDDAPRGRRRAGLGWAANVQQDSSLLHRFAKHAERGWGGVGRGEWANRSSLCKCGSASPGGPAGAGGRRRGAGRDHPVPLGRALVRVPGGIGGADVERMRSRVERE